MAAGAESAAKFHEQISAAKKASPFGAAVYVYDKADYAGFRLFLTPDGKNGFAVKPDGDIVSVFSAGGGVVHAMLTLATEEGGTKLDCFDTVLPEIYALNGFVETGRDSWNDEYKPDDWDYATFGDFNGGRPDIVYMQYQPAKAEAKPAPAPKKAKAPAASPTIPTDPTLQSLFLIPHPSDGKVDRRQAQEMRRDIQQAAQTILGRHLIPVEVVQDLQDSDAYYDPNDVLIRVALAGTSDPRSSFRHETIHVLREAGVFTRAEWAALARKAQMTWLEEYKIDGRYAHYREIFDLSPSQIEELMVEEAIADAFSDFWQKDRGDEDVVSRVMRRTKQFLEALANLARGRGYVSVDQVLENIETGKIGQRAGKSAQGRGFELWAKQESRGDRLKKLRREYTAVKRMLSMGAAAKRQRLAAIQSEMDSIRSH